MTIYPQLGAFGNLELIEVYEYYDKPLFLSCRNAIGHIYLTLLVDEDDLVETWLFVPVSVARFQHIRSGAIQLRNAFTNPEGGFVFEVKVPFNHEQQATLERISARDLLDESLPVSEEYLNLSTQTLPNIQGSLPSKSQQARREFLKLSLQFPSMNRTEAPAGTLGKLLEAIQNAVEALGLPPEGSDTRRGAIPARIREKMKLSVITVGAGSFEIELASTQGVNLFGESDVGQALQRLLVLLEAENNETQLKQQLHNLHIRAIANYAKLLHVISDHVTSANFAWATPNQNDVRQIRITAQIARLAISIIERTELEPPQLLEIRGQLIGANLDKKNYEIWESKTARERMAYSGRIANEVVSSLAGATLNTTYTATIRHTKTISSITGKVEEKYELVGLRE